MCERPFQLWQSSQAPLEPASPGGALASGLGVLWGCGEDAAGCGRDTHTSAGARARPPLPLPTSADQGMGWIRAGSCSLAALGGLRHPQAQLRPCHLSQDSPWGWGASPRDGREGDRGVPSHPAGSGRSPSVLPAPPASFPAHGTAPSPRERRGETDGHSWAPAASPAGGDTPSRMAAPCPCLRPRGVPKEPGAAGASQPVPRGRFGAKAGISGSPRPPVSPSSGCRPQRSAVGGRAGPGAGRGTRGRGVGRR